MRVIHAWWLLLLGHLCSVNIEAANIASTSLEVSVREPATAHKHRQLPMTVFCGKSLSYWTGRFCGQRAAWAEFWFEVCWKIPLYDRQRAQMEPSLPGRKWKDALWDHSLDIDGFWIDKFWFILEILNPARIPHRLGHSYTTRFSCPLDTHCVQLMDADRDAHIACRHPDADKSAGYLIPTVNPLGLDSVEAYVELGAKTIESAYKAGVSPKLSYSSLGSGGAQAADAAPTSLDADLTIEQDISAVSVTALLLDKHGRPVSASHARPAELEPTSSRDLGEPICSTGGDTGTDHVCEPTRQIDLRRGDKIHLHFSIDPGAFTQAETTPATLYYGLLHYSGKSAP